MGHKKEKHLRKITKQLINKKENQEFYQNGSDWKHYSTEREIIERRKL